MYSGRGPEHTNTKATCVPGPFPWSRGTNWRPSQVGADRSYTQSSTPGARSVLLRAYQALTGLASHVCLVGTPPCGEATRAGAQTPIACTQPPGRPRRA